VAEIDDKFVDIMVLCWDLVEFCHADVFALLINI